MRQAVPLTVALLACERRSVSSQSRAPASTAPAVPASTDSTAISVAGPALIAFYPDVSQAQVDSSEDLSTVLDDFSFHLSTASDSLRKLGFVIITRARGPLLLVSGASSRDLVLARDSADVGYVFARCRTLVWCAPGSALR